MGRKRSSLRGKSTLVGRRFKKRRTLGDRNLGFESLEDRRMLSAINWANRDSASNNFTLAFGDQSDQAKAVIDSVIADWERVITSFNYTDLTKAFQITISMRSDGTLGLGAKTDPTLETYTDGTSLDGTPSGATIILGWSSDTDTFPARPDARAGWYLDPDSRDFSDFKGMYGPNDPAHPQTNAYSGGISGGTTDDNRMFNDLYTAALHEMGHAMGLYDSPQLMAKAHDTGMIDTEPFNLLKPANTPTGTLWAVDTLHTHTLFTSSDNFQDDHGPAHFANDSQSVTYMGQTYHGANALMNASFPLGQMHIDDTTALILQDVYGYTIALPSSFGTFYDTLDADGTLRIDLRNLDYPNHNSDDVLLLSSGNGFVEVGLAPGRPIFGDPSSIISDFPLSAVKKIDIRMGEGNDTVWIEPISDTIPISLHEDTQSGNDELDLFGTPGHDTFTVDRPTIKSTGINIVSYNELDQLKFFTESGGADIYVPSSIGIANLSVYGGSAGEIFFLHSLDVNTPTTINGGNGDDAIFLDPSATSGFGTIHSKVTVYGNGGADTLHVGTGNNDGIIPNGIDADVIFHGGADNDTLYVDDSTYTGSTKWFTGGEKVFRATQTLLEVDYDATEAVTLYTGTGGVDGNTIFINGNVQEAFSIHGGSGSDTLNLTNFKNRYDGSPEIVTYAANFDLGGGLNFLNVDETAGLFTNFSLYPTQLIYTSFFAAADTIIDFANISGGVSINASDDSNNVYIYGVAATFFGYQHTILTNGGEDQFFLYPHDSLGNLTINGNLGLGGGGDSDSVTIDDTGSVIPTSYNFFNLFGPGTANVGGLGLAGLGVGSDVENIDVLAGGGGDTFNVSSFESGNALAIHAGGGNDTLNFGGGNIAGEITNMASFLFDGEGDADQFNLNNAASSTAFTYTQGDGTIAFTNAISHYLLHDANVESIAYYDGGLSGDFFLDNVRSATQTIVYGNAGLDNLVLGSNAANNVDAIQGSVSFVGGADGGRIFVYDNSDTTGDTLHLTPTSLGVGPGDNLFGVGGALYFSDIVNFGSFPGINLTLGSGADTIYAEPLASAEILIEAGDPSTSPGDTLHLGLSQTQNPVIQNMDGGSGTVTSTNRQPIIWHSIETVVSDYVATTNLLVSNTLDSGPGSLRQAMLDANATPNSGGPDVIRFSIPGIGAHTIQPLTSLPAITDPVVIDATTQPGYAGAPVIELNGTLAHGNGLLITSGGTTVRGLAINRFAPGANGEIWIQGPGGNVIQGNYLGTNLAGNAVFPFDLQASYGVIIFGSDSNVIGTNGDGTGDAAEGNVISGHDTAGILLQSGHPGETPDNNVIAGNRIGTSADGNTILGNARMGVFFILGGTGNRVGTNSDGVSDAAERNLISGNGESGISLDGDGNVIAGNYIGTNAAGNAPLPNGGGIAVSAGHNNRIGGNAPGASNVIAYNTHAGVLVYNLGTGNAILGNSIYSNGLLGIDLSVAADQGYGSTPNDVGDADSGPNNLQNFPQITTAFSSSTQTTIGGSLQSTPGQTFRVEFFANPTADVSGFGEGQTYIGFASVTTDSSGNGNFVATFTTVVAAGQFISATATDPSNNTSEFSASVQVVASSSLTNVAVLRSPITGTNFLVTSPVGTTLTASVAATAGVAPIIGVTFPFGLISFTVSHLSGASADVTISGLDTSQLADYYKLGKTPANRTSHWYNFLFGQATDGDSAAGTGMEFVSGNIVLHLIDGKRGDDDLAANGTIVDIGGPVLNHRPVPVNDVATINEDTTLTVTAAVLKSNDTDADNDVLTVTAVSNAINGTVTLSNGIVKFIPAGDFNGLAGFDYTISDGYLTATGHMTVTVKEVNDAPIANADTATVPENGTVDIEVRTNDSKGPANESGQTLTVKSASALHGTVTINSNGTLRYRPAVNYFGADTISYTITDNGTTNGAAKPLTSTSTVAVTVTPVNQAPVANDLTAAVTEDGKVNIKLSGSDHETSAAALIFTVTSLPTQGQLSTPGGVPLQVGNRFTGAPTLVYEPGAAREGSGSDGFKYTVTDAGGAAGSLTDEATVALSITKAVDDGKVTLDTIGIVRIGGTNGDDSIVVTKSGTKLQVTINGKVVSNNISLSSMKEIKVWGRAGNDKISVLSVDSPTLLHGGAGNDEIVGGPGSNLLFGDAGNDKLQGGLRNDLLVGGAGTDTIIDSPGNDVLLGGNVTNQFTEDFYRQVLQQWDSGRSQNSRFKQGITDDGAVDLLFDGLGDDWYFVKTNDLRADLILTDHDVVTAL